MNVSFVFISHYFFAALSFVETAQPPALQVSTMLLSCKLRSLLDPRQLESPSS
jgi:hypothetical protein